MDNLKTSKYAAGYVRVSTLIQVEHGTSIDEQKKIITNEAASRGLTLAKIYSDEGISGKSIKRPALSQLLKDAKNGGFSTILFTKLDRLARNLRDTLNIYHETNELGVEMICIDDPVISTNGPMGSVMLSIMGTFAQFERELIKSRTSAGRMSKWKSGESMMGHLPFGYKKNGITKKIEIDDYKKDIILRVYNLYLIERLSMLDIANRLTDEGYKTPSSLNGRKDASKFWNMNAVREILTKQCYTGEQVFFNKFKFQWSDNNNLIKTKEEKPTSEWVTVSFPAIIDKNMYIEAQQKIAYSKAIAKRTKRDDAGKFLSYHLLYCGECRAKISKQTTGTRKYAYYTCHWRRASDKRLKISNKKKCSLPFLKYDIVDKEIYNIIINLLANPHLFAKLYAKDIEPTSLKERISSLTIERENIEKSLKKSYELETNTNDSDLLKIYQDERRKTEEKFISIKNNIFKLNNELSFHKNRNERLEKFQKVFSLNKIGNTLRLKKKIIKLLLDLPFDEKKKLLDAVICPETGGRIFIRPFSKYDLAPEDIISTKKTSSSTETDQLLLTYSDKENAPEEKLVIEMDFTLDPYKISQIIQGIYNTHFKVDKL